MDRIRSLLKAYCFQKSVTSWWIFTL